MPWHVTCVSTCGRAFYHIDPIGIRLSGPSAKPPANLNQKPHRHGWTRGGGVVCRMVSRIATDAWQSARASLWRTRGGAGSRNRRSRYLLKVGAVP